MVFASVHADVVGSLRFVSDLALDFESIVPQDLTRQVGSDVTSADLTRHNGEIAEGPAFERTDMPSIVVAFESVRCPYS